LSSRLVWEGFAPARVKSWRCVMIFLAGEKTRDADFRERKASSPRREDEIIERRITRRLRTSPYLSVRRVTCRFHEGMLRLQGRVPSYYLKQMAQTMVLEMEGVDEIDNQLEVITPPAPR
jgi:osmotically-inducible protein OsmY